MKKLLISFLCGATAALAFAPLYLFLFAVISISGFFLLCEAEANANYKKTFLLGFSYGYGYFLSSLYWIANSLLIDAEKFGWLIPFALIFIPGALAVYFGVFTASYKFLAKRLTAWHQKIILFALLWLFFELLRSILFTGFPWNLIGYIWFFNLNFVQPAAIFGIYGLSFFAVLVCLLPTYFRTILSDKWAHNATKKDKILFILILFLLVLSFTFGLTKLHRAPTQGPKSNYKIRLVQPNIEQTLKWDPQEKYSNLQKLIALSNQDRDEKTKVIVWPETAIPYPIQTDNLRAPDRQLLAEVRRAIPPNGSLIAGGLRSANDSEAWNSVFAINEQGIAAIYDKHHLVPFGEYVPFARFLPFIDKITEGAEGFQAGEGAKTLAVNLGETNFTFSPLVCYEAIFTDETIESPKLLPNFLINLTNDAWFGNSSEPHQHLDMARLRAIEYGVPLIRVTDTGISAAVDSNGKIVAKINQGEEGFADVDAAILTANPTFYAKHGLTAVAIVILLSLVLLPSFPRKRESS